MLLFALCWSLSFPALPGDSHSEVPKGAAEWLQCCRCGDSEMIPAPWALIQLLSGKVEGNSCTEGMDVGSSSCFDLSLETC